MTFSFQIGFIATATLLSILCESVSSQQLSLKDAIGTAMKNNLGIKGAVISKDKVAQDLEASRAALYPSLSFSGSSNMNFGRSLDLTKYAYVTKRTLSANGSVNSSAVIFNGFQLKNQIKQTKLMLESGKDNVNKIRNDVTLEVVSAFLSILRLSDQLTASVQQEDFAEKQLDYENKNFIGGKKILSDVSRARSQVSKNAVNTATIRNQLNAARLELAQLMDLPPEQTFSLEKPADSLPLIKKYTPLTVYERALGFLPEIKIADYYRRAAETAVEVAKGYRYPRVSLSANLITNYTNVFGIHEIFSAPYPSLLAQFRQNMYEYVGINISVPIFNNRSARTAVSKARLDLQDAEIRTASAKSTLLKVVTQANADLDAAESVYDFSKNDYQAAKETFNTISRRYAGGLANSLDYSQSQNDMNVAEFQMINAKYDMIFKQKVIDFYLGAPISY